jgi:hypothetical protein
MYFLEIDGFFFTLKRTFINHYLLAVSRQKSRSLTKVNMKKQIRAPTNIAIKVLKMIKIPKIIKVLKVLKRGDK